MPAPFPVIWSPPAPQHQIVTTARTREPELRKPLVSTQQVAESRAVIIVTPSLAPFLDNMKQVSNLVHAQRKMLTVDNASVNARDDIIIPDNCSADT